MSAPNADLGGSPATKHLYRTVSSRTANLDWLLHEKEPDFGGNAYMMDFRGAAYGTGSAFVESPGRGNGHSSRSSRCPSITRMEV